MWSETFRWFWFFGFFCLSLWIALDPRRALNSLLLTRLTKTTLPERGIRIMRVLGGCAALSAALYLFQNWFVRR